MILKKPYAFLIKYFKLIHIILAILIGYIIKGYSNITDFFVSYTKSDASYTITSVTQYINPFIYLALLIIIIFSLAMFILMRKKKKPTLFYIIIFVYYLILMISVLIASNVIGSLVEASLSQQTIRVFRDIYLIISVPQYYFIVMSIIRGIGFDVKKFNFSKDLQELEIKSEDDEEFEFIIGEDSYLYKRKIRRFLRETKYYILENKLMISIISGVIFIPLFIYLIINSNIINNIFGSASNIGNFTIDLKEAYETQYDYNGNLINKNKKYLILDMIVTNKSNKPQKFEETTFFLKRGKNFYYNKPSLRNYFIDIGKAYTNENIASDATKNLIFVFEIENKFSFNKYYLNILKEITYKDNQEVYNYTKLKIKPIVMNESPKRVERQEKEVIRLGKNLFNDSNIILSNIEIIPSYEYTYELCKNNICKEYIDVIKPQDSINQNLLIITYKTNLSKGIGINNTIKNNSDFFDKFLKVEYTLNNKEIVKSFASRTYNNIENKVFIDLPKVIVDKSKLNIMINTRNNHHFIKYES